MTNDKPHQITEKINGDAQVEKSISERTDKIIQGTRKEIPEIQKTADEYYSECEDLLFQSRIEEGIQIYHQALAAYPNNDRLLSRMAAIYSHLEEDEKADEMIRQIDQSDIQNPTIYSNLANFLRNKGDFYEALGKCTKAFELSPNHLDTHIIKGIILSDMGQGKEGLKHLKKAIEIDSGSQKALLAIGYILMKQGDFDEAISMLQKCTEINEKCASAFLYLGNAYSEFNQEEEAIESYTKVLALEKADKRIKSSTFEKLEEELERQLEYEPDRDEKIVEILNKLLESNPDDNWLITRRGMLLLKNDRLIEAERDLQKAIDSDSSNIEAHLFGGLLFSALGRPKDALKASEIVLKISPDNINALANKGMSFIDLKQYQEAVEIGEEIIELEPEAMEGHIVLGIAQSRLGQPNKAIQALNQASKLGGRDEILSELAACYKAHKLN